MYRSKQTKSSSLKIVAARTSLRRSIQFLNRKTASYRRLCFKIKESIENNNPEDKPNQRIKEISYKPLSEISTNRKDFIMSYNSPVSSRLMAPTKAFSAKQPAINRTPFSRPPTVTSKTPGPTKFAFDSTPVKSATPRIQRGTAVRTPLVTGQRTPTVYQRAPLRQAPMTVGRPQNSSTLKRDRGFNTPSSKVNKPTAVSKTVDCVRLKSIRRSIQTLQNPLNSVKTPPEVKTPASKIFRKIFASGNSGTKIPIRTGHFKEFKNDDASMPTTPVNRNLEKLKKRSSMRRSSVGSDLKGLDDEACLLITPSLMRRLICSAAKIGGKSIKKSEKEESVKVHSVKPSSLLKYLFGSGSNEETNSHKVETLVSKEAEVEMDTGIKRVSLFKTQELGSVAEASGVARVFGNTSDTFRPACLFSQAVSCKESVKVEVEELSTTQDVEQAAFEKLEKEILKDEIMETQGNNLLEINQNAPEQITVNDPEVDEASVDEYVYVTLRGSNKDMVNQAEESVPEVSTNVNENMITQQTTSGPTVVPLAENVKQIVDLTIEDDVEEVDLTMEEPTPIIEVIVPMVEESAQINVDAVSIAEEAAQIVQVACPVVEEPVPAVEEQVPIVEEPVPIVEERVPIVEEPAPIVEEPVPIVEEPVPATEELVLAVEELVPAVEELVPAVEELVPAVEELVPAVEELALAVEELVPVVEEPVTVVEKSFSTLEEPVPFVEEPFSTVEEPFSTVEESKTIIDEIVPIQEEPAKTVDEPTPTVEVSVPVVEEPTQIMEEIAAVVEVKEQIEEPTNVTEETIPIVEEITPVEVDTAPVVVVVAPIVVETAPIVEEIIQAVVETAPIVEEIIQTTPILEVKTPTAEVPTQDSVDSNRPKRTRAKKQPTPPKAQAAPKAVRSRAKKICDIEPIESTTTTTTTDIGTTCSFVEESTSIVEETIPVVTPVVEESIIVVEEVVPVVEEVVPVIKEVVPVVEEVAPVVEEVAPVVEEAAPVVEEAAPTVQKRTRAKKQPAAPKSVRGRPKKVAESEPVEQESETETQPIEPVSSTSTSEEAATSSVAVEDEVVKPKMGGRTKRAAPDVVAEACEAAESVLVPAKRQRGNAKKVVDLLQAEEEEESEIETIREGAAKPVPVKKAPVKKAPVKKAPVKKAPVNVEPVRKGARSRKAPVHLEEAEAESDTEEVEEVVEKPKAKRGGRPKKVAAVVEAPETEEEIVQEDSKASGKRSIEEDCEDENEQAIAESLKPPAKKGRGRPKKDAVTPVKRTLRGRK